jgi:hypothetical protein
MDTGQLVGIHLNDEQGIGDAGSRKETMVHGRGLFGGNLFERSG